MLKRLSLSLVLVVIVLLSVALARTLSLHPESTKSAGSSSAVPAPVSIDAAAAIERFASAVRIPTVSEPEQPPNQPALAAFRAYLETNFPRVHATLRREIVGDGALLFTWPGTDPSLGPILLMGHMDVVPVEPGTEGRWIHPPFSGQIADGYVWGRGSMDDKAAVLSLMQAAEALLAQGYTPRRTILFAFGDDEENDGHGAESIVALLKSRNIHPEFVMDEGGGVTRGLVPGVRGDVAMVGIAEKGILSLQLTAHATGGHSSQPPKQTAIGILSKAVVRIEAHQMPARITPVAAEMFDALAPRMSFGRRFLVANRWLFNPVLVWSLARKSTSSPMVRTTTAVTIIHGGIKDNVLPSRAVAVVNFRILPGDTIDKVTEHTRRTIHDSRVTISIYPTVSDNPRAISPTNGPEFALLQQTIEAFFPNTPVAPNLLVARTDSVQYYAVTPNVYRFFPSIRTAGDRGRVHGTNERMSTEDYLRAVQFMARIMKTGGSK